MSKTLCDPKQNSLIVIDEFGCNTTASDGISLLASALTKFSNTGQNCPHVIISTHFQHISAYLSETSWVTNLRMDHTTDKDNSVIMLYKTVDGVSRSFAFEAARAAGLNTNIINRAMEIFDALQNNTPIKPLGKKDEETPRTRAFYVNINIPELDE